MLNPAIVTAWRGYTEALTKGDPETVDYTYRAFVATLETLLRPHDSFVVAYSEVPQAVDEFVAPLLDGFIREAFANLREAFSILYTLSGEELPTTWDGMEAEFVDFLEKQRTRINAGIPEHVKTEWETLREQGDNEDDEDDYDWSDDHDSSGDDEEESEED